MIYLNDLSTCDHVDSYKEEQDEDEHWPFLNHQ